MSRLMSVADIGVVRDDLHTIDTLCHALPSETFHRGVNGEAMMLLAPTANPEAWRNRAMSAIWGRLDAAYLEDCHDEQHPLWVLGTWEQLWRDHLGHHTEARLTLPAAIDYLDVQMTYMAGQEDPPFSDFAADLHACRTHLEDVLSDGIRDEVGAPCMYDDCGGTRLVRHVDEHGGRSDWECRRCERTWSDGDYWRNVKAANERAQVETIGTQTWCSVDHAARDVGRPVKTIRTWVNRGQVSAACMISGRRTRFVCLDEVRTRHAEAERHRSKAVEVTRLCG